MIDDLNDNNIDNNITDYQNENSNYLKMMKTFFSIEIDGSMTNI